MPHKVENINNAAVKNPGQGFESANKFFKTYPKDIFRALRMGTEWARLAFSGLDDLFPAATFISAIRTGESTLCFPEMGASLSKLGYNVTKYAHNSPTKSISAIRTSSFDSVWNFHKLVKWFDKCKVITFGSRFLTNITVLGGIAFTTSSAEKLYIEGSKLLKVDMNNDTEKQYHILRIAKTIGALAIGIIVTLKALVGLLAPAPLMLFLGTMMLTTNFAANLLKETEHLQLK